MPEWRPLLDSIRVPWRDRGKNTSAGNVNTCCPWCRDDQGYHLSIAEDKEAYYCYRNPNQHSGTNLIRLLVGLGVSRAEATRLLNEFKSGGRRPERAISNSTHKQEQRARLWKTFLPASELAAPRRYLAEVRQYPDPVRLALRYDLRVALEGTWAARILLPIHDAGGGIATWTGRAIHDRLSPKYLVALDKDEAEQPLLYIPDPSPLRYSGTRLILVEGPLDALRIMSAEQPGICAIALGGKSLAATKLWRLRQLAQSCRRVEVCMDADAALTDSLTLMNALRGAGITAPIQRLRLPDGYKDAGEMPIPEITPWLEQSQCSVNSPPHH